LPLGCRVVAVVQPGAGAQPLLRIRKLQDINVENDVPAVATR
jgi:hypothetical protein